MLRLALALIATLMLLAPAMAAKKDPLPPLAVICVTSSRDAMGQALRDDVMKRIEELRDTHGIDRSRLALLPMDFERAPQRVWCEQRLGITRQDLPVVELVALDGDLVTPVLRVSQVRNARGTALRAFVAAAREMGLDLPAALRRQLALVEIVDAMVREVALEGRTIAVAPGPLSRPAEEALQSLAGLEGYVVLPVSEVPVDRKLPGGAMAAGRLTGAHAWLVVEHRASTIEARLISTVNGAVLSSRAATE